MKQAPIIYNTSIHVSGTVNGNIAGINNGAMTNMASEHSENGSSYKICPDFKNSNRESHKLIKEAIDAQKSGDIHNVISLIEKAIDKEAGESPPDLNTIVYSKYLLVYFLGSDIRNDREILPIIDEILRTDGIDKDETFYRNVLIEKANVFLNKGEIRKARAVINAVKQCGTCEIEEDARYLSVVGFLNLFEGNVDDAILLLSKGRDNALSEYTISVSETDKFSAYQHYFAFLTSLGKLYGLIHRPDLSYELWKTAVQVAAEIGWTLEMVNPLFCLVRCLVQYDKYDSANKQLDNIYAIIKDGHDPASLKQYYHLKAIVQLQGEDNWTEAVNCYDKIIQISSNPNEQIRSFMEIAELQANHGAYEEAMRNLERAKKISDENSLHKLSEAIDVNRKDIRESVGYFDHQVRHSMHDTTLDELQKIEDEYKQCENAIQALNLSLYLGQEYIHTDPDRALRWLSRTYESAIKMKAYSTASEALIGQACVFFGKQTEECEMIAEQHINTAIEILGDIPIWAVHARAKLFKGMAEAHKEKFVEAHNYFCDAQEVLVTHNVKDRFLHDCVLDCIDECEFILSKRKFSDIDFDTIIEEASYLKHWYPKYKKELLHFLWYNRHDDIERLLMALPKSKAFIISDELGEVQQWSKKLNALFDIFSFSSETDYHTHENWRFPDFVPVPENMKSKYFDPFIIYST